MSARLKLTGIYGSESPDHADCLILVKAEGLGLGFACSEDGCKDLGGGRDNPQSRVSLASPKILPVYKDLVSGISLPPTKHSG